MKKAHLALMVFVDEEGRTLLQDRTNKSKLGEEWGYFGGSVDDGESPERAVVREIREELEFEVENPTYLGHYVSHGRHPENPGTRIQLIQDVFITRVSSEDIARMQQHEGAGKERFTFDQARRLNMYPQDMRILDDAERYVGMKK